MSLNTKCFFGDICNQKDVYKLLVHHISCHCVTFEVDPFCYRKVSRASKLEHNRVYRLMKDAGLSVLAARALSGLNPATPHKGKTSSKPMPAIVTVAESKEITRAWLTHLIKVALAKGNKVDEWRLTEEQQMQWAAELVQCFPGELVPTWYAPKASGAQVSIEI